MQRFLDNTSQRTKDPKQQKGFKVLSVTCGDGKRTDRQEDTCRPACNVLATFSVSFE